MFVQFELVKCPSCDKGVDVHFMNLSSLIGPTTAKCFWRGEVVKTDRIEWWEMAWKGKAWFFGMSALYVVLAYFLGGLSTNVAVHFLKTGQWRNEWGLQEPTFWVGGGAWALVVALIQLCRVVWSLQRKNEIAPQPLQRSFWTFQLGGQWKVLILLLLIPTICWLVAAIR